MVLRQEVDDILNHTETLIFIYTMNEKFKWKCKKCSSFLGKEYPTASPDKIKKLLRDFSIGKYWKCRFCKHMNYFKFTPDGIIYF